MKKYFFALFAFGIVPLASSAVDEMPAEVRVFDQSLTQQSSFSVLGGFTGGADIAVADIDKDGNEEIVVAAEQGGGPLVQVLDESGTVQSQFFAYDESVNAGVNVDAALKYKTKKTKNPECSKKKRKKQLKKIDNGKRTKAACTVKISTQVPKKGVIVTGTGYGAGPQVGVFDGRGNLKRRFFAFGEDFRGGVDVAVGDYNNDGKLEIAAAAGAGGDPHVRIFTMKGEFIGQEFRPFASGNRGGVRVETADVIAGDGDELVMSIASAGEGWTKVYSYDGTVLGEWKAFDGVYTGLEPGVADIDGDGADEVMVTPTQKTSPQVVFYEGNGDEQQNFYAFAQEFNGGARLASGDIDGDGDIEVLAASGKNRWQGRTDKVRYIDVDISEQLTTVYEYGRIVRQFPVSTGVSEHPTPLGEYDVKQKIYNKRYQWTYGPDHPDNYDIENVKYNLRYTGPYYLHGAYWHNNFGNPMSHGCTNIDYDNAEWLYNWAEVGDTVINHY